MSYNLKKELDATRILISNISQFDAQFSKDCERMKNTISDQLGRLYKIEDDLKTKILDSK